MRKTILTLIMMLALLAPASAMAAINRPVTVNLSPTAINIGTLYDGTTLTVTGDAPADCEVVVRFQGPPEELHMKEKGKALNLLWMNKGSVTFDNVPKAYLVASSKPMEEVVGPDSAELGLSTMAEHIEVQGTDDDKAMLIGDLLALKGQEGLYAEQSRAVTYGPEQGNRRTYTATLNLPAKLAPGSYTVEAVTLKNGYETGRTQQQTTARLTGGPAMLAGLAFNHGALYGVLATVIALLAGLGVGLVFQGKGGAH